MPTEYAPSPAFHPTITIPLDGEDATGESLVGIQKVADRTESLKQVNDAQAASIAAIEGVNSAQAGSLANAAYKNQPNTFTQLQIISAGGLSLQSDSGELSADGHINGGKSVYAGVRGIDDGNPAHSWEFLYGQVRTRVVNIAPASGVGNGNVAALWQDGQGTPVEGYHCVLQPNDYVFYPIIVPHGATMKTVVVKLVSPGVTYDARLIRRYAMVMTDTSYPKYEIKARVDDISLSGTTANRTLSWGSIAASSLEDYALYIKNKSGGQPLHVMAIQFTYEEQYLRTWGSR